MPTNTTTPPSSPGHEQIAERARSLWAARGKPVGRDLEHWLEAERQVRAEAPGDRKKAAVPEGRPKQVDEAEKRLDGLIEQTAAPARRTPKGERL